MEEPIDLLIQRMDEISDALRNGINNGLDNESIEKLVDHYNRYFVSIQLINSHTNLKRYRLTRLFYHRKGNIISYRSVYLNEFIGQINRFSDKKTPKEVESHNF